MTQHGAQSGAHRYALAYVVLRDAPEDEIQRGDWDALEKTKAVVRQDLPLGVLVKNPHIRIG